MVMRKADTRPRRYIHAVIIAKEITLVANRHCQEPHGNGDYRNCYECDSAKSAKLWFLCFSIMFLVFIAHVHANNATAVL